MKTLQELKGKSIEVVKFTNVDETHDYYINLLKQRLQPQYLHHETLQEQFNNIEILSKHASGNKLEITVLCKDMVYYEINKQASEIMAKELENSKVEYIEKINRYRITGQNFKYTFSYNLPIHEQVQGLITFRASGDYTFTIGDVISYGDKIKASELVKDTNNNIIGFKKLTYSGEKINYMFT